MVNNGKEDDMSKILDGKQTAADKRAAIKRDIDRLKQETGVEPGLAVILVGDDPASAIYVKNKEKACRDVGIESSTYYLPADVSAGDLLMLIDTLNEDDGIHGILCQLPLPAHLDTQQVLDRIHPDKDVDGFHPLNAGRLALGRDCLMPCTPAGIMEILDHYNLDPAGRHCVIVGRSTLVGKPLIQMMLSRDATVTVAHSKTKDLPDLCRSADILVAAAGRPGLITKEHIRPGAWVIDVGINRTADGKVCGDVCAAAADSAADYYTPVPGGIGPMTITMLLNNTVRAFRRILNR